MVRMINVIGIAIACAVISVSQSQKIVFNSRNCDAINGSATHHNASEVMVIHNWQAER